MPPTFFHVFYLVKFLVTLGQIIHINDSYVPSSCQSKHTHTHPGNPTDSMAILSRNMFFTTTIFTKALTFGQLAISSYIVRSHYHALSNPHYYILFISHIYSLTQHVRQLTLLSYRLQNLYSRIEAVPWILPP